MLENSESEEEFEEYSSFNSVSDCSSCIYFTYNSDFRCAVNPTYKGEDICNDHTPSSDDSNNSNS